MLAVSRVKVFFKYFFLMGSVFFLLVSSRLDTLHAQDTNLRGVLHEEAYPDSVARNLLAGTLYFPRQLLDVTLYGMGEAAAYLSDPEFIEKVEDILYLYKRELAWFPLADYGSSSRISYGGGLYYKHDSVKLLLTGLQHDADFWSYRGKASYRHEFDNGMAWEAGVLGLLEHKDDKKFWSLGSDPKSDSRNHFRSEDDYGTFTEDKRKIQWDISFHPTDHWRLEYLGYFQRRGFKDSGSGDHDLRDVFDVSTLPGFSKDAPVKQLYDEVSLRFDSRKNKKILSPGFYTELYTGLSAGIDANDTHFMRAGGDLAAFIPTIREDRLIVPRLVVDITEELNNDPLPFSEYARHRTFRGVSSREWIRSEEVSIVPSLEYQWPLSPLFSGHLFFDYLAVGQSFEELKWEDGLWATGFGINLHHKDRELGKLQVAGGSEGFQLQVTLGTPLQSNQRSSW